MDKITIFNKINEIVRDNTQEITDNIVIDLKSFLEELYQDLIKDDYTKSISNKSKLAAIKQILKNPDKAILECFTRVNDKCMFTDGYQAYIINDDFIPFKVAGCNGANIENLKEYASRYGLEFDERIYPDLQHIFDTTLSKQVISTITYNVNDLLLLNKTIEKDFTGKRAYTFTCENGDTITLDTNFMVQAVKILGLKDKITMEFRGVCNPVIIENNNDEIGLVLPIRTF